MTKPEEFLNNFYNCKLKKKITLRKHYRLVLLRIGLGYNSPFKHISLSRAEVPDTVIDFPLPPRRFCDLSLISRLSGLLQLATARKESRYLVKTFLFCLMQLQIFAIFKIAKKPLQVVDVFIHRPDHMMIFCVLDATLWLRYQGRRFRSKLCV